MNAQTASTRPRGIGASDLATILGVGYKSPLRLWGELTGNLEPEDATDKPWLEWGHRHQPAILKRYNDQDPERDGHECEITYQHPKHPLFYCTPDAWDLALMRLVEIKTSETYNKPDWEDGIPMAYWLQVQHQYEVMSARQDVATVHNPPYIAALIGLSDYREYEIAPQPDKLEKAWNEAHEWWTKYVEGDEQPPADPSPSAIRALRELHPDDTGEVIQLTADQHAKVLMLNQARQAAREAQKHADALRDAVEAILGAATYGVAPDGSGVSLKWHDRKEYTVQASRARRLTVLTREKARREGIS